MKKGEIYLVPYPYTDFQNFKIRPALVLINFMDDVIITSQISCFTSFHIIIQPIIINGLSVPSLIKTGKVVTISKKLFKGRLGNISTKKMGMLDQNLKQLLQII